MKPFRILFLFRIERNSTRRLASFQRRHNLPQHVSLRDELFACPERSRRVDTFCITLDSIETLFCILEVSLHEFQIDDLDVVARINVARDVVNVVVIKNTYYLCDSIYLTDVREKLIPQPLPFRGAFHESRDIDEFNNSRNSFLRVRHLRKSVKSVIRHCNDTDRRINRRKRIIRNEYALACQRIE